MTAGPVAYRIDAPHGDAIDIPDTPHAADVYAQLRSNADIRAYYDQHGYVVLRGLLPPDLCDRARDAFTREVKPYTGFIYRQTTANPEKHVLTEHGYVLNPVLNIQDLSADVFPQYKRAGYDVLTALGLQRAVQALFGESGTIVQSMHFEGNPSTWAHQDTYYLDSTRVGAMTAAWIALEDIAPGSGRFFVYPGSHRIDMAANGGNFDYAFNHDRYRKLVLDVVRNHHLECRAPALAKGDVLLWSARTIHGSLKTTQPERSRSSITAHFIPGSTQLLQFQARVKPLRVREVNGVRIHHPKDQDRLLNRAILWVETRFPKAFQLTKRLAIKIVTTLRPASASA